MHFLSQWLNNDAFPNMFPVKSSDGKPLNEDEKRFLISQDNLRLGPPVLRQFRLVDMFPLGFLVLFCFFFIPFPFLIILKSQRQFWAYYSLLINRFHRVRENSCQLPWQFRNLSDELGLGLTCLPDFNKANRDDGNYDKSWAEFVDDQGGKTGAFGSM